MTNEWIKCDEELPPEDGIYEISNYPDREMCQLKREWTATAYYDGYGFEYLGVYRHPAYWRKYNYTEKRYGKIKDEKQS